MKILHTADWHIGQFKGPVVDGVNLRSQDTVKCLEYMVQVAIEEKPDIVCVSGDIFHQEQVGPVRYSDEMITATNIITSLAHFSKYVIVMRGTPNHDGAAQFRVLERMLLNIRNVVGFGTNKTVYHFEETQHLTEVNHKISTTGMVTRVKIIGKANDDGCSPVEATVDGKTSYGIRQKIVSRGTNDTLDEAKKEAREILADDGKPKEEITIKLPDIPIIRKGDKIHLKTASISAGYL